MRQVKRTSHLKHAQADSRETRTPIDHYTPAAVPPLAEAYIDARDRRRAPAGNRMRKKSVFRKIGVASCALLVGVAVFGYLSNGTSRRQMVTALHADIEHLAVVAGFGIEQVSLKGHRFTLEDEIFDALDLPNTHSLLSFEPDALRERLQRLPWIKTVAAARVYPGQLQIRVTEREPAAVWRRGGQNYLIDEHGRVLAAVDAGILDHLPRLRGEGAAEFVAELFALLQRFPDVAGFVTESERVGARRWTLHLVGGGEIHLPPGQESQAIEAFLQQPSALALIQAGASAIDLRAHGRIVVRPASPNRRLSARSARLGT